MTRILLLLPLLMFPVLPAAAEQQPGFGVVESVTPLRKERTQESASTGASSAARRADRTSWLVRVRMDDGSIQVREMKKRSVGVGSRVLLTNAGDVLPD
jgi:hypothetical protein